MDLSIHIDTMSMGLPIVYINGSRVAFISVPEGCFKS